MIRRFYWHWEGYIVVRRLMARVCSVLIPIWVSKPLWNLPIVAGMNIKNATILRGLNALLTIIILKNHISPAWFSSVFLLVMCHRINNLESQYNLHLEPFKCSEVWWSGDSEYGKGDKQKFHGDHWPAPLHCTIAHTVFLFSLCRVLDYILKHFFVTFVLSKGYNWSYMCFLVCVYWL